MRGTPFRLDVVPELPAPIARLAELANDLWYSWDRPTRSLFARIDPALWQSADHSPKAFLRGADQERLREVARDADFLNEYARVLGAFDAYLAESAAAPAPRIAYFCAEFGLHESLPIYSGGLGILAGDHCKTASDLRLPFVGVGLLYRQGYFQQRIDAGGRQVAHYADTEFDALPIEAVHNGGTTPLRVLIDLPGRTVALQLWRARVGHVVLLLLDSDIEPNSAHDRSITHRLYVGDRERRLEQELVLGIGGARALTEIGFAPQCWHLNEGHPAFLVLERIRLAMAAGLSFEAAQEAVAADTVFTTHTVVPAGHDHFSADAVAAHLRAALPELEPHLDALIALGRIDATQDFNMTTLAVRGSRHQNGVSRIHGRVSEEICAALWPQIEADENPMGFVTNGVHLPTFLSDAWSELYERHLGADWLARQGDPETWRGVDAIPESEFWTIHQRLKSQMLHLVRHRVREQVLRNGGSEAHLDRLLKYVDPDNPNILTIGFARRFATYKRATLLFQNLAWLEQLLCDAEHPVVLIFAGKAHPDDGPGQELLARVAEVAALPEFESRILLVEGYDLRLGRRLVSGVDVWLNNPVYPMEACGTSGMKAALNGVLNLSVLDGWWAEGYDGRNGWGIKPASERLDAARRDAEEARTLYEILQDQVIPLYYANGNGRRPPAVSDNWVAMAKHAVASLAPKFSSRRMLDEYLRLLYQPAAARGERLQANGFEGARALAGWKTRVRDAWPEVTLRRSEASERRLDYGRDFRLSAEVGLGGLAPEDVAIEVVFSRPGSEQASEAIDVQQLNHQRTLDSGEAHYALEYCPRLSGRIEYRFRAYPSHPLLTHPFEMGLMHWL